jgi:hypothetical protein
MAGTETGDQLRVRATALRALARKLDNALALDLHRRAGTDVWIGPTPQHCYEDVRDDRRSLLGAAESLRSSARILDQRARQFDAPIRS